MFIKKLYIYWLLLLYCRKEPELETSPLIACQIVQGLKKITPAFQSIDGIVYK